MSNLFLKYFSQRIHRDRHHFKTERLSQCKNRPIITISRQSGCSAPVLAKYFQKTINKSIRHNADRWTCIEKDMMMDSAKKLSIPVQKIKYVYHGQKKSNMDEIFGSLSSRYYKSDKLIRKTIVDVMKEYAQKGNIIVVGRGGIALSKYVDCLFNIRLVAPIEWRIKMISVKHGVTDAEAYKYILKIDNQRKLLIEEFTGQKLDESLFDITFNCQSISKEDIVQTTLELMKKRAFI